MSGKFVITGSLFAVLAAAAPVSAATILLDAECGANPVSISASSATCVYEGSVVSAAVTDADLSHITVMASMSPPPPPPRLDWVGAEVRYDTVLSITFIAPPGVSGDGWYIPCVSGGPPGDFVSGWLDGVGIGEGGGLGFRTCSGFRQMALISLNFGVPQTQHLHLAAATRMLYGKYTGDAYASLNGFQVYDSHFKELTGVQWIVTEVPEPTLGLAVLACVAMLAWKSRVHEFRIRRR